ncbi:TAP-like protein-domain-containing protein [Aspergillus granulosus]|uniref:TAP-like protein-domain-containing protein n=1 Tax=Aspergillus granulosus TaxID=176169 RepID=A0ABR4HLZ6_9EURO
MENSKHPSLHSGGNYNGDTSQGTRFRRNVVNPAVLALTALAGLFWWFLPSSVRIQETDFNPAVDVADPFSWNQITPSQSLEYHECFDGFQCARLDVPMDWQRSDGQGTRMAIAIIRLPAKVPVTDPAYGGAVITNPGGPGGSGVAQVLLSGHNMQTIVDAAAIPTDAAVSEPRFFDIISFDPRGVNNTTPGFSCFPNLYSQKNWELQVEADGMLGSSADSFMRNWQRAIALNTGCSKAISTPSQPGADVLGEHTNTPPVARDMLEIIERHGEWREQQGLEAQSRRDESQGYDPEQGILTRTKWKRGQEKILYWGRSYGTVLGATFAALFPNRVERMVLDGVVDSDKYYSGVGPEPVGDADAIFDKFAIYCDQVGEQCPFYAAGGPAAIQKSYKELENVLLNSSMSVLPSQTRGPEVATWTDLKTVLRIAVYQPLAGFSFLADIASNLLKGDGAKLADYKHARRSPTCPSDECLVAGPWSTACQVSGQNELYASSAILCSDAEYMQSADEESFKQHWRSLQELSSSVGDYWSHIRLNCAAWSVKPKWKMPGKSALLFAACHLILVVPVTGNTSHPILLVNNILDPVTPLQSAKHMSGAFPGSVLLQQDSEGHCTLAAPSVCVSMSIRKYFQTGELPAAGTVCNADLKPLLGHPSKIEEEHATWSMDDITLYKVLLEEAQRLRPDLPL